MSVKKQNPKWAAEVLKDRAAAARTKRERISYLNMPEAERARAIEKAEKQKPIVDVPRTKKVQ